MPKHIRPLEDPVEFLPFVQESVGKPSWVRERILWVLTTVLWKARCVKILMLFWWGDAWSRNNFFGLDGCWNRALGVRDTTRTRLLKLLTVLSMRVPDRDKEMIQKDVVEFVAGCYCPNLVGSVKARRSCCRFEVPVGTNAVRNLIRETKFLGCIRWFKQVHDTGWLQWKIQLEVWWIRELSTRMKLARPWWKPMMKRVGIVIRVWQMLPKEGFDACGVAHSIVEDGVNSDEGYSFDRAAYFIPYLVQMNRQNCQIFYLTVGFLRLCV